MHITLFQILAVLRQGPSEASDLLERLRAVAPADVPSLPAFYRHLRRGIEEGWLEIDGTGTPDEGPGRPARIYRLTPVGVEAVRERALELDAITALALERPERGDA
ncbi:MAG: PadR family transcriptional regulator [Gemmatimonadota bacterium]|jgi:DNA-binding PadR family transcriptional regulator